MVRDELLEPLGMTRTTTRPSGSAALGLAVHPFADVLLPEPEHDAGAMAPAGQLWTTVTDLARWATFLGGDTADLLSADTLAEMVEPHHVVDDPGQPWVAAHGLGFQVWNVGGARFAGHGGSMPGFLAGLRVRLDAGVPVGSSAAGASGSDGTASGPASAAAGDGVVLFTNTTASTATRSVVDELLDGLARHEPAPVEAWSASGDPALLELVGTWHWGPATVTARVAGEHLVLGEPGAGRGARFRSVATDEWLGLDSYYAGEPLRVVRRRRRVGVAPRPRVVPVHPHALRPAGRRARAASTSAAGPDPTSGPTRCPRRAPPAGGWRRPRAVPRSRTLHP